MERIIYARLVDKEEAKRIKKLCTIGIPTYTEFVSAFEAANILQIVDELSKDDIKLLHKFVGGDGSASRVVLFIPEKPPVVSGIPFRNSGEIRRLLHCSVKESKFLPDTIIEIKAIIK